MKVFFCVIGFPGLVFFLNVSVRAQIHDFDSLVNHSVEFKAYAKSIEDTLDLFDSNEILNITFESDFKHLIKNKYRDEYQDAVIKIMINDTVQVTRKIEVKPRGNVRKSTCMIPPLKLNFEKKEAFLDQMKEFDKIKMVLDCKKGTLYDQYLLLEYYAYRMQNMLTDYSLRTRLLSVTYVDTSGKMKEITQHGFFIENIDQLATRLNAIKIETKNIKDSYTDHKTLAEAYLFQYMIGNTDWSIPAMHNVYLIKSTDPNKIAPCAIPYDFDYAGIVDANYAIPDPKLGIATVRERVYRGICLSENEVQDAAKEFLDKKNQIYDLYQNDQLLDKNVKNNTLAYLDEFFEVLENKNLFKKNILDSCR